MLHPHIPHEGASNDVKVLRPNNEICFGGGMGIANYVHTEDTVFLETMAAYK